MGRTAYLWVPRGPGRAPRVQDAARGLPLKLLLRQVPEVCRQQPRVTRENKAWSPLDSYGPGALPLPRANEGRGAPAAAKVDAPTPRHGFDLCHGDPVLLGEWVDGPQFADPPNGSWCSIHIVALDFRAERPRPLEPDTGGYPITRAAETPGYLASFPREIPVIK
jgi:hypothetical protein